MPSRPRTTWTSVSPSGLSFSGWACSFAECQHFRWELRRADGLQKSRQLRGRLVLRNWFQFFERTGEGVGQAPHGSRLELLMHRLEVQIMHSPREVFGKPSLLLDECLVDQQLCRSR